MIRQFEAEYEAVLGKAGGSVVNIASVHAINTKPGFIAYATSKTALVGLTKAMAVDIGPWNYGFISCPVEHL